MDQDSKQPNVFVKKTPWLSKRKITTGVFVLIILGLGAAVWWLFATDRLVYNAAGTTDNTEGTVALVCNDDIVNRYNAARLFTLRDGSDEPSFDEAGLTELVREVKSLSGYEADPTCQTIVFWDSYDGKDYEATKRTYETLRTLHEQDKFADTNLSNIMSISDYGVLAETLSPDYENRGTN